MSESFSVHSVSHPLTTRKHTLKPLNITEVVDKSIYLPTSNISTPERHYTPPFDGMYFRPHSWRSGTSCITSITLNTYKSIVIYQEVTSWEAERVYQRARRMTYTKYVLPGTSLTTLEPRFVRLVLTDTDTAYVATSPLSQSGGGRDQLDVPKVPSSVMKDADILSPRLRTPREEVVATPTRSG